jgi:hypothetical protein
MNQNKLIVIILLLSLGLYGCTPEFRKVNEVNHTINETVPELENGLENNHVDKKGEIDESSSDEEITESFIIDIGDGIHTFKVMMEAQPFEFEEDEENLFFDSILEVSVYDINDLSSPVQITEDKTNGSIFRDYEIVDANFDGYMDFSYLYSRGNANYICVFWIWDPETKAFKTSDELNEISMPQFDPDLEVVSGFWRDSAASNESRYYKYIGGKLTCVRIMEMGYPDDNDNQILSVQDYRNGHLVEVFHEKALLKGEEGFTGEVYDKFFLWHDLNYCGE